MNKKIVLYHNHCPDGFGAAWAAWKKFGKKATYIGVNRGEKPPKGLEGKELYIVDFCYTENDMKTLLKIAKKLVVLDHHKSSIDDMKYSSEYMFDNNHSGAVVTWKYFHPTKKIPYLLRLIEDYDLWKFRISGTREFGSYINSQPYVFSLWNRHAQHLETTEGRKEYRKLGSAIRDYEKRVVEHVLSTAEYVRFAGHKVLAVNSGVLASEIGNQLAKKHPPFSLIWSKKNKRIVASLRSVGTFDVSRIALKFGGGGHRNASGFSFMYGKPFPWKEIKK